MKCQTIQQSINKLTTYFVDNIQSNPELMRGIYEREIAWTIKHIGFCKLNQFEVIVNEDAPDNLIKSVLDYHSMPIERTLINKI